MSCCWTNLAAYPPIERCKLPNASSARAKAGHTGTLDPMATGLLPICFGDTTRFSSALLGANKSYEATLRLGYISTTGDAGATFPSRKAFRVTI